MVMNEKTNISGVVVNLLKRALPILAVGFPGGYKFLVVMIITTFTAGSVSDEFSKTYFWVGLLVSFSGLPVATLMVSASHRMLPKHQFMLVFFSAGFAFFIAYFATLHNHSLMENAVIFISTLFLAYYETTKRHFLNSGEFYSIFIVSSISLSLFFALFFFTKDQSLWLLLSTFSALLLPMFVMYLFNNKVTNQAATNFLILIKNLIRYILSSITSTSLMALVPLIIISEVGDSCSSELAQVFSFSSLLFLLPRVLSAKHIPNMRKNGIDIEEVFSFFHPILLYTLAVVTLSLPVFYSFYDEWLVFWLLFLSMQASQLSLPFSNVLMVRGNSHGILKVNYISALTLITFCTFVFIFLPKGVTRVEWLLLCFVLFQLFKLILSRGACQGYFTGTDTAKKPHTC